MKKKYIVMLVCTLIIGIVIGILSSGLFFNKKSNRLIVAPTKDFFKQKAVHLIKPDDKQLMQIESSVNKFSEKMYLLEKENNSKIYNNIDSLYIEIKPALTQEQKDKFEKRLNHINSEISK
jgi:MFS superfamily sulfate permease-like transporter